MAEARGITYPAATANTPTISSAAQALAPNPNNRAGWGIMNLGTNPLYVLMGDGATTSVFHIPLKAGTVNDDGTGGTFVMTTGAIYAGSVTIAGTSPRYTVFEL